MNLKNLPPGSSPLFGRRFGPSAGDITPLIIGGLPLIPANIPIGPCAISAHFIIKLFSNFASLRFLWTSRRLVLFLLISVRNYIEIRRTAGLLRISVSVTTAIVVVVLTWSG